MRGQALEARAGASAGPRCGQEAVCGSGREAVRCRVVHELGAVRKGGACAPVGVDGREEARDNGGRVRGLVTCHGCAVGGL